jgi:hypothetical protein
VIKVVSVAPITILPEYCQVVRKVTVQNVGEDSRQINLMMNYRGEIVLANGITVLGNMLVYADTVGELDKINSGLNSCIMCSEVIPRGTGYFTTCYMCEDLITGKLNVVYDSGVL